MRPPDFPAYAGGLNHGGRRIRGDTPLSREVVTPMPTRRILEVAVAAAILMRPVFGLLHIWSAKTLGTTSPGSIAHGAAEIVAVVV